MGKIRITRSAKRLSFDNNFIKENLSIKKNQQIDIEQYTALDCQLAHQNPSPFQFTLDDSLTMLSEPNEIMNKVGNLLDASPNALIEDSLPVFQMDEYDPPSTPPAQIATYNEMVFTPVSQKQKQIEALTLKLGATQNTIDSMGPFAMTVAISQKILKSTPVKNTLNRSDLTLLATAAPMIANMLEMGENLDDGHLSTKTFSSPGMKNITSIRIPNKEGVTTTIVSKTYHSGSRVTLVPSLQTYSKIEKQINKINKVCNSNDKMIADAIRKLSKNQPLEEPFKSNESATKLLSNITTLLFIVEADRSFVSSISAHMFLDLIESGEYTFRKFADLFPMAMKGAMKASKVLDKLLFIPLIRNYTPYDHSDKIIEINDEAVERLVTRNTYLCNKWLELKENKSAAIDPLAYAKHLRSSIASWYDFELRPFALIEGEELPLFTRNIGNASFSAEHYQGQADESTLNVSNAIRSETMPLYLLFHFYLDSPEINLEDYSFLGNIEPWL